MEVHSIRLRAPWKLQRKGDRDLWQRAFGRPTNVSQQEAVRLVLQSETTQALATLNGQMLGAVPGVYEVTDVLKLRNVLELSILRQKKTEERGGVPPFDVRLEIGSRLSQDDPIAQ